MKILAVIGTRPEVMKLAPVILQAKTQMEVIVCSTGQHKEILQQAFRTFDILPDLSLDLMSENQSLSQLSAKLMTSLSDVMLKYQPDWVVVQGDTTSALIGGLAAFYHQIPVAHVEAGLRTHNKQSPFPEEMNRQLLSKIASRHFAPTGLSANHLLQENILPSTIFITGNTIVDTIFSMTSRWNTVPPILPHPISSLTMDKERPFILVTCHRRESFGAPLMNICRAIRKLHQRYRDFTWIFPVHPNPHVSKTVHRELTGLSDFHLVDPLDYETTLYLLSRSQLVLTDSGGIQEEAPSFSVPMVVMRNHTERQEIIDAGFARLAGDQTEKIIEHAEYYLNEKTIHHQLKQKKNPYGDGKASIRITQSLLGNSMEAFHG